MITAVKRVKGIESLAGALVDPSEEGVLLCQQLPAFVKAQEVGEAVAVPCSYWEAYVTSPGSLSPLVVLASPVSAMKARSNQRKGDSSPPTAVR